MKFVERLVQAGEALKLKLSKFMAHLPRDTSKVYRPADQLLVRGYRVDFLIPFCLPNASKPTPKRNEILVSAPT
jgi:hypothetical protein